MKRKDLRGFTLVEVLVGLVVGTILLLGMGTMVIHLFTGIADSGDFAEATGKIDTIRQLTFDARTGEELLFPTTNGTSGAWTSGGFSGHQVRFRAIDFDPDTGVSTRTFINWESRRPMTASPNDPYTVFRWVQRDTNGDRLENDGGYVLTFQEFGVDLFTVRRETRNNFSVEMRAKENEESAHIQMSVSLRNVK